MNLGRALMVNGDAQRRPGRESRRHRRSGCRRGRRCRGTLNEGRDVNPGDTRACRFGRLPAPSSAQRRRPGRESRRHLPGDLPHLRTVHALNEGRDVNPGDTLTAVDSGFRADPVAQRRPGRESRRHLRADGVVRDGATALNEGRDVNPGDTPGAGNVPAERGRRSTKAGT